MSKTLIVYSPHPDDELLSMWPFIHYLAAGYEVHVVFMSRGPVTALSLRIDGVQSSLPRVCTWADHNYLHDPDREGYALPTAEEVGLARLAEGKTCIGAMSMIPPLAGQVSGQAIPHDENLPTNWGANESGSSTAPVTEEGIVAAYNIMTRYIEEYPNALHWTMSPSDAHPDHAACGLALRRHKQEDPALANSRFFVSKLYWSTPAGQLGSRLGEPCQWYPGLYGEPVPDFPRRAEYLAWIKAKVLKAYTAWNPTAGVFAIGGGHSVPSQFANCYGPSITASNFGALWHE